MDCHWLGTDAPCHWRGSTIVNCSFDVIRIDLHAYLHLLGGRVVFRNRRKDAVNLLLEQLSADDMPCWGGHAEIGPIPRDDEFILRAHAAGGVCGAAFPCRFVAEMVGAVGIEPTTSPV